MLFVLYSGILETGVFTNKKYTSSDAMRQGNDVASGLPTFSCVQQTFLPGDILTCQC